MGRRAGSAEKAGEGSPLLRFDRERLGAERFLIGIDEAGRGCLAGPVVAGAVVLERTVLESSWARETMASVNDSKQLSAGQRAEQFAHLERAQAAGRLRFATGLATVEEIATLNILGATRLAMRRALEAVVTPEVILVNAASEGLFATQTPNSLLLIDGRPLRPFPYGHEGVVKGDARSFTLALASIAAKVTRDALMERLEATYPGYGLAVHKGYGTSQHRDALTRLGAAPVHRSLFLRKILGVPSEDGPDRAVWTRSPSV